MKVTSEMVFAGQTYSNEGFIAGVDTGMTQRAYIATQIFARAVTEENPVRRMTVEEVAQRSVRAADVLILELQK